MKLLNCVILFIVLSNVFANAFTDEEAFQNWAEAYDKQYTSEEFQDAFAAWKANLDKVAATNGNLKGGDVVFKFGGASNLRALHAALATPVITYPKADLPKMSMNKFSDMTYEQFSQTFMGADASLAPSAAAGAALSTGAIAGIVVGGVAAIALVGGLTYAVTKKRADTTAVETPHQEVEMKRKSIGIDIFKFRRDKAHKSITARGTPIVV
ncbi:hypothetical protein SAMD00019534_097970 [Acytostelium subglobosum LB1]|uniref:hypothetical protein n=1 Tax=Acytostelium subglobosum LB1 TaxID=1410327 RepID=UPI0006450884|nr:hypothetical protein SAMD00019534_097970 [Acytostelium subglobosum LB1]GAM26622.1 hypothetical protein SAMD00019534_097970 [Acytostelium subglobosum LB1]|eukprot:XP_012750283.1 hypothetical protein SAMD00019534_097970 [Acytostelium subglobosum LB1]